MDIILLLEIEKEITVRIQISRRVGFDNNYRIYSAIRRGFHLSRMTINNLISSM